jgi:hypothetical protein
MCETQGVQRRDDLRGTAVFRSNGPDNGEAGVWEDNREHHGRLVTDKTEDVTIQGGERRIVASDDRQGMGNIDSVAFPVGDKSNHQRRQGGCLGKARTADRRGGGTNSQMGAEAGGGQRGVDEQSNVMPMHQLN